MTIDSIQWNKLAPYGSDKRRSFEELCYQIVRHDEAGKGRLSRIDGSGGDGGVEFYLELPNGDEWGWQAKFFFPDVRIDDGRKTQVKRSLQKACREHPRLARWTLCTPGLMTKGEKSWFGQMLPDSTNDGTRVVPEGRHVELVSMHESDILAALRVPALAGLVTYFFGNLELSLDWFRRRHEPVLEMVRKKFNPTLHAVTGIDQEIEHLLAEKRLLVDVEDLATSFRENNDRFTRGVEKPCAPAADTALKEQWPSVQERARQCAGALGAADTAIAIAVQALREQSWRLARDTDLPMLASVVDQFETALSRLDEANEKARDRTKGEADEATRNYHEVRSHSQQMRSCANSCAQLIERIRGQLSCLRLGEAHLLGTAGGGKTHIAANIVTRRLAEDLPGILLLGRRFTSTDAIEVQVRGQLGLDHVGWDVFVDALVVCADLHGCRIPIVIDGLNEAIVGGGLSPVWRNHLVPFCVGVAKHTDALVLVTTCRPTYQEAIWEDDPPKFLYLNVGTNYDVREAMEKYFQHYKIVADPTAAVLSHFEHPIYLRLFCEVSNPERSEPKEIVLGEETLYGVFNHFLDTCNARIREKLDRPRGARLVLPALQRLGRELWERSVRSWDARAAREAIDGAAPEAVRSTDSLLAALEHEDVLIIRDWDPKGEFVGFAFDLMAGYCVAQHLLDNVALLSADGWREKLFSEDVTKHHPLAEDITRAVAALAPSRLGKHLREIVSDPRARAANIGALFEIDPKYVRETDAQLVVEVFEKPTNRQVLFELAEGVSAHPRHPLNARFWSERLRNLAMPERDVSWTEYVRGNRQQHARHLAALEQAARHKATGARTLLTEERLALLAERAMWILTSTIRPLRDEATRALYWFGRACPMRLLDLVRRGLGINDPYVPERLLAALYGVVMARSWEREFIDGDLVEIATQVFSHIFARAAPHPTTHALARDYARGILERALFERPNILTENEKRLASPPYRGMRRRRWGTSKDRDDRKYRDGNSPLGMDFANYTLNGLVRDRQNYDFDHPEYKKVRSQVLWRLYDLGYSLGTFGAIDQWIARSHDSGRAADAGKTDRYGKKYAWIAYFELAGRREDRGLLPESFTEERRLADVDIEPSFSADARGPAPVFIPRLILPNDMEALKWFSGGAVPVLDDVVFRPGLVEGDETPWVLLDGFLMQEEGARHANVWFSSFILDSAAAAQATAAVRGGATRRHEPHEMPSDYYLFAGEVPWAAAYPANSERMIRLVGDTTIVQRRRRRFLFTRDGKDLPDADLRELLERVRSLKESVAGEEEYRSQLTRELAERRVSGEEREEIADEEVVERLELPGVPTCRRYSWEGYHTTTAGDRVFATLDGTIGRSLNLRAL